MAKKKRNWGRLFLTLAFLVLALAGAVYFIRIGLDALEKSLYPRKYQDLVEHYAAENDLDPLLLYSVIRTESGFNPDAQSNVDARGLMQITDETFQWIKSKIAPNEDIVFEDLYDPETNIRFGSYYFSRCMDRYNDHVGTAAAAYHSGWGTVDKLLKNEKYSDDGINLHTYPYEQMGLYVQKIGHAYSRYQACYSNIENEV